MRSRFTTAVRAAARAAFFVSALFALSLAASPAGHAQTACADRDEIVSALASGYGEQPAAIGLAGERVVVEVFTAPGGATWTILLTGPDGVSCAILAGEAWSPIPPPVGDET